MNIYDIANAAGVSIATVSRVINNSGYVGKATREKILSIIDENNYMPSSTAKNLSTNASQKIIGIICYNIEDLYYAKAVSVLEKKLKTYGYDIILSCTGESRRAKEKSVGMLISKNIDALIFVGSVYAGKTENLILNAARYLPVFIINAKINGDNIYSAYCDDENAVFAAASEVLASGKNKILYLYDAENFGSAKKIEGFLKAADSRGIVKQCNQSTCADIFAECYKNESIDAVMTANDMLAAYVLNKISALNLDNIAVIGHNNSAVCDITSPTITSIDNKVGALSNFTADNIKTLFESGSAIKHYEIDFEIIKRQSF